MSQVLTLMPLGSAGGDVKQILPDRGKGVKRTVIIWVQNAANATAFISRDRTQLMTPDNLANICGIPIGKNGATAPLLIQDWEGPMYGVSGAGLSATVVVEEGFS